MNVSANRVRVMLMVGMVFAVWGGLSAPARAIPTSVDLTNLRAIQPLNTDKAGDDSAYLLVSGIANGKEFSERFPKDAWTMAAKKPVGSVKEPVTLWKGDLADGEFALVTVTLFQGKGEDAGKLKEYLDKKTEAEKKVTERAKPKLNQSDFDNLSPGIIKAQQGVVKDIKKMFSRDLKTDHFGGLFTVLVWNNGGKLSKRLDPVGLTFGEHYGVDPKIYTKIKNTRSNVMVKDDTGDWSEQQLTPLTDDNGLRVKMLETELVKSGADMVKNVTDYLAEIQVKSSGKALPWNLGGMQTGPTELHTYWEFAE